MRRAIELAGQGEQLGEVPVGAVVVCNDEIIGEGFNKPITSHDPTAHAEIIALRMAAERIQNYRIVESTLYVTLEPCTMCVGALIHARISRLVYGTTEPKAGVVVSQAKLLDSSYFNHRITVNGGVLAEVCQHQLSDFFRRRREELKQQKNNGANVQDALEEDLEEDLKKNDR
ncbi:MAG: tRNA adenosine(34) deaminase TadA [Gammaproteobacteria bacterium]|nr:MAG: tRNA adenosine(34) deaminase TadA [Gammaproteobacteria bacterium]